VLLGGCLVRAVRAVCWRVWVGLVVRAMLEQASSPDREPFRSGSPPGQFSVPGELVIASVVRDSGRGWRATVRAVPQTLAVVREALGLWLERLGWPAGQQVLAIVTAVNEAVSNVVEHAYPDSPPEAALLEVDAAVVSSRWGRRVRVVVRDNGVWRTRPQDQVGEDGLGLRVMRLLMDEVVVHRGVLRPLSSPGPPVSRQAVVEGTDSSSGAWTGSEVAMLSPVVPPE
jgi:anti-sigma regulatory factor (Ser/Thr protein kinase)